MSFSRHFGSTCDNRSVSIEMQPKAVFEIYPEKHQSDITGLPRYLNEININIYVNRVLHNEGLVPVKNLQKIVVALNKLSLL
jgi:hypothetical protein